MNDIEKHIGIILRVGVVISICIILVGVILLMLNTNIEMPNSDNISLEYIINGILSFNPWSIMLLGILMLIATPLLRVIASIISFAIEKDLLYVIITTTVLIILVVSIAIAIILK